MNDFDTILRDAIPEDGAAIAAIYNHYVISTAVSMEFEAVDAAAMGDRIAEVHAAGLPWLVLLRDGSLLGYAYASRWRARPGYRHAVETSVYLAPQHRGGGLGRRLYRALLARLPHDVHAVIGGIALPNPASVALHERLGFRQVACFEQVGRKFGEWVDVGYWQLSGPRAADDASGNAHAVTTSFPA